MCFCFFLEDVSIELTHGYHDLSQTVTLNKNYGHRVTFRAHNRQEVHVVSTQEIQILWYSKYS